MKGKILIAGALLLILASAFVFYQSSDWKVKEGYSVKVFRNPMGNYPIFFKGLKAEISFDPLHPEKATIQATIDANTVDTGVELMTEHAKEEDVLDVNKFPVILFKSRSVRSSGNAYETTGELTLKGITREITFPFTFENETFTGKFDIVPGDFNITRDGSAPSAKLWIELTIPVTK